MFQSARYSQIALRVGLALVFFWSGINMFVLPQATHSKNLVALLGIFDILVAVSISTGFFMRWFVAVAALSLVAMAVAGGFTDATIPGLGLVGALVALAIWPERMHI